MQNNNFDCTRNFQLIFVFVKFALISVCFTWFFVRFANVILRFFFWFFFRLSSVRFIWILNGKSHYSSIKKERPWYTSEPIRIKTALLSLHLSIGRKSDSRLLTTPWELWALRSGNSESENFRLIRKNHAHTHRIGARSGDKVKIAELFCRLSFSHVVFHTTPCWRMSVKCRKMENFERRERGKASQSAARARCTHTNGNRRDSPREREWEGARESSQVTGGAEREPF